MLKLTEINKKEAERYMGYGNSLPDSRTIEVINTAEQELLKVISPKYLYKVFDIAFTEKGIKVLKTPLTLLGKDIANHLQGCTKIILMCATLSVGADKQIKKTQVEDMVKALATDSLASAAIEQVCAIAEVEIESTFTNCFFTWRYSPGYGDLPIEHQKDILSILDSPRKIGLCTSENSLLIPTKSITAIIGISTTKILKEKQGCESCNKKNVCKFKRKGEHCV